MRFSKGVEFFFCGRILYRVRSSQRALKFNEPRIPLTLQTLIDDPTRVNSIPHPRLIFTLVLSLFFPHEKEKKNNKEVCAYCRSSLKWVSPEASRSAYKVYDAASKTGLGAFPLAKNTTGELCGCWNPAAFATTICVAGFFFGENRQRNAIWRDWIFTKVFFVIFGCYLSLSRLVTYGWRSGFSFLASLQRVSYRIKEKCKFGLG